MKKKLCHAYVGLVLAAFGVSSSASAAQLIDLASIPLPENNSSASVTGQGVISRNGIVPSEFRVLRQQKMSSGKMVTRYQQFYHGVPIWGQTVVEERHPGVAPNKVYGKMVTEIQQDLPTVSPTLPANQVLEQAKVMKAGGRRTSNEKVNLVIRLDQHNHAQLVYLVSYVVQSGSPTRPNFLIDANTGSVLKQWEGLTNLDATGPGGNIKTGEYEFGSRYGYLVVSPNCTMDNGTVAVINLRNSTDNTNFTPFQFNCPRNTDTTINGAYSPINDAYYFGNAVYKMYQDWLGIPPLSGKLNLHVHYGRQYENAFWDGVSMYFGDGAHYMHPLVSVDITGHEVSHGFTEQNSGLIYEGQSGGINEAFSDMAGAAAEFYVKKRNTWQIGADITKGTAPLRYMDHPSRDGRSIEHASLFYEGMDPHYSSGVFNKAFYLLSTNNTSSGWNLRRAFEVFADANRFYWNATSTYNQAACGVQRASNVRGYDTNAVAAAFAAVGVHCQE